MANFGSSILRSDSLQRSQPHEIDLWIQQTAGTQTFVPGLDGLASAVIMGDASSDFTQAACNSLLGVSNDIITATVFGSTAMGTDSFGMIVACNGQIQQIVALEYQFWLATMVDACFVGTYTAPTDALSEVAYCSPAGNVALRVIPAGFDAGTNLLHIKLNVILK